MPWIPAFAGMTRMSPSWIAIGVGGAVAALQTHLMRAVALRPGHEEARIEFDAAIGASVELDHPALDPVGIELRIDCAIERIGKVDPLPVTADLDHLRAAACLLYTSPSPRDGLLSRMPSSA